jgi:hypothetical protein
MRYEDTKIRSQRDKKTRKQGGSKTKRQGDKETGRQEVTDNRAVVGKHPDLLVGQPTSTEFPTNDRNFERSQFFEKIFEKI